MAKTVNLINPETGATVTGTITDEEYALYISEGYEEVQA
jgi:hypothetical protein